MTIQNLVNIDVQNSKYLHNSQSSPMMDLVKMIFGTWISQSIYVAASLGIADLLKDDAKNIDELARLTNAKESKLYRVMRTLASVGIFTEIAPRKFGLTEMAEYLRSDVSGSLRSVSMMLSDDWHWRSWGEILHVVKTGKPALEHIYQVKSTFEYLKQNPQSEKIYNDAMTGWSKNIHTAVVEAYDFSSISNIVDIAGGQGMLISSILKANPQMKGILFDRANVVADAKNILQKAKVSNRCEIIGGDFFISVPSGGDAYIMSHIIHDWGDEDCIKMLKIIRQVMPDKGKLLIIDMVVPASDTPHLSKWMDIDVMIMYHEGRERTEAEFCELLQASGFKLTQIIPTNAPVSVIEGVPV